MLEDKMWEEKMMIKKFIAWALSLSMLISVTPVSIFAQPEMAETYDEIEFNGFIDESVTDLFHWHLSACRL